VVISLTSVTCPAHLISSGQQSNYQAPIMHYSPLSCQIFPLRPKYVYSPVPKYQLYSSLGVSYEVPHTHTQNRRAENQFCFKVNNQHLTSQYFYNTHDLKRPIILQPKDQRAINRKVNGERSSQKSVSVPRLNHCCFRNAMLEFENGAL